MATLANGNRSAKIFGKWKTNKRACLRFETASGKIVRIAVNFPGVQLQRVTWYENKTFVGIRLGAESLIVLLSVVTGQPHPLRKTTVLPQSSGVEAANGHDLDQHRAAAGGI